MFDFNDVRAASKSEQVRAWSVDKAIESFSGLGTVDDQELINRADEIESYVLKGKTDG